jgi:hypothetical protein
MLTLKQCGDLVGFACAETMTTITKAFGMRRPFSLSELVSVVERRMVLRLFYIIVHNTT